MAFASTPGLLRRSSPTRRRQILRCNLDARTHIATCTGPTCKQSNSPNILVTLQELCSDTDDISVEAVGCLGECGNGPNVGITCRGTTPRIQTGIRNLRDTADLLRSLGHSPSRGLLEALEQKEHGDDLMSAGNPQGALEAYDAVVPTLRSRPRLLARVLCNRSAALRELGLGAAARDDANKAVGIEPGLAGAWKRKAEAHEFLKEAEIAVQAWTTWGRLAGTTEEAARRVKRLRGWRFAIFGG